MSLREAREILDEIENDINLVIELKNYLFIKGTQPKSVQYGSDKILAFKKQDKFLEYVEKLEQKGLDKQLKELLIKKEIIEKWHNKELDRLRETKQVEYLVVYYRDCVKVYDKEKQTNRQMTWEEISKKIYYSPDWCRHIYCDYNKNTRKHTN